MIDLSAQDGLDNPPSQNKFSRKSKEILPCQRELLQEKQLLAALEGNMRKSKRRQRHSLPFALFLAAVGALLLPAALAPRANAGSTDYWDSEYPLGFRPGPAPELLSQAQGVLINQPLFSNYNPTLALNVASGGQPGMFQPFQVDALFSWTGTTNTTWSTSTNWSPAGPPGAGDTASFDRAFSRQPNLTANATVGGLLMTTGVAQNVTLSATVGTLTIPSIGGTGILVNNTNAFTLTISAGVTLGASQAWTNSSGNLFTVSGTVNLDPHHLTVNGTGNTLISGVIGGTGILTKDGSGTLTLTGSNTYGGGTVDGGTLLVNNTIGSGTGTGGVTVSNAGTTLGGTGTISGAVTVNAGANIAPGNGGNSTAVLNTGALTLASASNFRVNINGPTIGSQYDQLRVPTGGVTITGSNLVVTVGTTLSVGQMFTVLNKATTGPITGTFAGIPEGGNVVGSNGTVFSVSYIAGDGRNDVVLTVLQAAVPEPSTWIAGALGVAGLVFTQRRRLQKLIARYCALGS